MLLVEGYHLFSKFHLVILVSLTAIHMIISFHHPIAGKMQPVFMSGLGEVRGACGVWVFEIRHRVLFMFTQNMLLLSRSSLRCILAHLLSVCALVWRRAMLSQ